MNPPWNNRDDTVYLPTGWRVVGGDVTRLAVESTSRSSEVLVPGAIQDTLYALRCTFPRTLGGRPTVERVLEAVVTQLRQNWRECPRLIRDEEVEVPPSRFGGLTWTTRSSPGTGWDGDLIWRHVHPVVAGAALTTRVFLEERAEFVRLGLRVTADEGPASVRGFVGAGQAQPTFLRDLRRDMTPTWEGALLGASTIRPGEMGDFVVSVLASPDRNLPVVVLSPLESGAFVLDPGDLAWDLLGRARLYVLEQHQLSFDLTDAVRDRRMSCFLGAARCYLPGWSHHDDPYQHPLLVRDRLSDPVMRSGWMGEFGIWSGVRVELPPPLRQKPEIPAPGDSAPAPLAAASPTPETAAEDARPAAANRTAHREEAAVPAPDSKVSALEPGAPSVIHHDPGPEIRHLAEIVGHLAGEVRDLVDEVQQLRTISAVRSSSTNAIERRLGRLEEVLARFMVVHDADPPTITGDTGTSAELTLEYEEERLTLTQVVNDATDTHADALVFLRSAYDSAAESPYEDPERVRAILDAMARVARRRAEGGLGTSLREAFSQLGIDYRGAIAKTTPARLREQYRFTYRDGLVEAEEHIVLGNTYDPRRCLRVYFSSRDPTEPRFIIAHVGRHFEVVSTT